MRKIALCLVLLAIVSCQDVVLKTWTGNFNSGDARVTKTYNLPKEETDVAVYGWFKVDSKVYRDQWSTIFHLTSNDANFVDASKAGDRVLAFFNIGVLLHTPTYTTGNNNAYLEGQEPNLTDGDLDKWAFFYVAYGFQQKRKFAYFNLASSGVKTLTHNGIVHSASAFYRLYVGQSVNYKYFPGQLFRVTFNYGGSAYREDKFNELMVPSPNTPAGCSIVYSECNFGGSATNLCESKPNYDVTKIRSIYIADGYKVTVFDKANYDGKKVSYTQTINCITELNFALLVDEQKIVISDQTTTALRRQ